jgi:hypothetical protein
MRTRHELREEEAQRERGGEEGTHTHGKGDGRRATSAPSIGERGCCCGWETE